MRRWLDAAVCASMLFQAGHAAAQSSSVPHASQFKILHRFCSDADCRDGNQPNPGLIIDASGNVYGTTSRGGFYGYGTVFKIAPDGKETVLHSFANGSDGAYPSDGLKSDAAGNLYGYTALGGSLANCAFGTGCGVVFRITPDGTETILHSFVGGNDGDSPSGLLVTRAGVVYGLTYVGGGLGKCYPYDTYNGCGTIFKISADGRARVLFRFRDSATHESYPAGDLVLDKDGDLFGTASEGGADQDGTIFKLAADGTETTVYSFKGGSDAANPDGLISDSAGNLYGSAAGGSTVYGTIFKFAVGGTESVIHTFCMVQYCKDGAHPTALILGAGGDFFGLAQYGPGPVCGTDYGCGEIFRLTPSGAISAIYTFKAGYHLSPEGLNRQSGIFYGAAPSGDDNGRSNAGAVYRFAD